MYIELINKIAIEQSDNALSKGLNILVVNYATYLSKIAFIHSKEGLSVLPDYPQINKSRVQNGNSSKYMYMGFNLGHSARFASFKSIPAWFPKSEQNFIPSQQS